MHPWRPIVLVGIAFAGLAMLFPFATFPVVGTLDGLAADAWPALLPLIPVAVRALVGDWSETPRPLGAVIVVALACCALLFAIVKLTDALVAVRAVTGAAPGAGPIVLIGGTLVAVAGTVVALSRSLR